MDGFWKWFIGEAGAGWIFGLVGLVGMLAAWFRRARPARVMIQEVEKHSLLSVHRSQQNKLKIGYVQKDGVETKIDNLIQTVYAVYNTGSTDIEESITLGVGIGQKENANEDLFVRYVFEHAGSNEVIEQEVAGESGAFQLSLPYLSRYDAHHDHWKLFIISNRAINLQLTQRVGRGWSALMSHEINQDEVIARTRSVVGWLTVGLMGLGLLGMFVATYSGYNSPLYRYRFSGTDENIALSIQTWTEYVESAPTSMLGKILSFVSLTPVDSFQTFPWWGWLGIIGSVLLIAVHDRLDNWIIQQRWGMVNSNQFRDK